MHRLSGNLKRTPVDIRQSPRIERVPHPLHDLAPVRLAVVGFFFKQMSRAVVSAAELLSAALPPHRANGRLQLTNRDTGGRVLALTEALPVPGPGPQNLKGPARNLMPPVAWPVLPAGPMRPMT